jgi:hypothetical protein
MKKELIARLVAEKFEVNVNEVTFKGKMDFDHKYNSNEGNHYNYDCDKIELFAFYPNTGFRELNIQKTFFDNGERIEREPKDHSVKELANGEEIFFVVHNYGQSEDISGNVHSWNYIDVYLP